MNFVSMNNYKNFEIDITSNNAMIDMPDYFKKTENKYTYSNGNKDAKIKLILDEYSVADFQWYYSINITEAIYKALFRG